MSWQATAWAIAQQIVTDPMCRHVLLCLANYAGEDGRNAWPSVRTLCKDTGRSKSSVHRALAAMEALAAIRRGNQAIARVSVERADRRPVVWDLDITRFSARGITVTPGQENPSLLKTEVSTGHPAMRNEVSVKADRGVTLTPKPPTDPSIKTTTVNLDELMLPPGISRDVAAQVVGQCKGLNSSDIQDFLDLLSARRQQGSHPRMLARWIDSLIRSKQNGTFDMSDVLKVRGRRIREAEIASSKANDAALTLKKRQDDAARVERLKSVLEKLPADEKEQLRSDFGIWVKEQLGKDIDPQSNVGQTLFRNFVADRLKLK